MEEEFSENARSLRDEYVRGRLRISVPTLIFYETLNALRFSGVFDEYGLIMAADSMSKYGFEAYGPRDPVYRETARLSYVRNITVYDAAYVALAEHLHCPLYSTDNELLDKFPRRVQHIKNFKPS